MESVKQEADVVKGHTPGPWTVSCGTTVYGYPVYSIHGFYGDEKRDTDMHEANARLIAAAPELLASLKELIEDERFHVAIGGNPHAVADMLKRAATAIRKAEGHD